MPLLFKAHQAVVTGCVFCYPFTALFSLSKCEPCQREVALFVLSGHASYSILRDKGSRVATLPF